MKLNPILLADYDRVIQDQIKKGIVEVVNDATVAEGEKVHYLPHHGVIRQDMTTSKLRIVYDVLARSTGPSLNDCLYMGPRFGQSIFDILLRFRVHEVAFAGGIEKAFLIITVDEKDGDMLRFL